MRWGPALLVHFSIFFHIDTALICTSNSSSTSDSHPHHSQSSNVHCNILMFSMQDIKQHTVVETNLCQVSGISDFRFAHFQLPISRFHDRQDVILRYPMLSVLTCKAVTRETSPLPGVFDADLIHNDEEQESAFGFYMQSNNIGEISRVSDAELIRNDEDTRIPWRLTLTRGSDDDRADSYRQRRRSWRLTLPRVPDGDRANSGR